jgi:prepilin-type N-terminal cleavage/methylation domain-containing protein
MKPNTSRRADGEDQTFNILPVESRSGPKASAPGRARSKATQAMTLVEMMVAIGVGSIVLAVVATVFTTGTRAFAAMSNYVMMDCASRNAIDQLTREIRQAGNLVEFSPTHLKFGYQAQTNSFLVFDWNAASGQLTEWNDATTTTNILLSGCDQLAFSLYNTAFAPTNVPSQGKGISVSWSCSRTLLGQKSNTEDMQQALIIIRNKPL